jgi:hypothetical protein
LTPEEADFTTVAAVAHYQTELHLPPAQWCKDAHSSKAHAQRVEFLRKVSIATTGRNLELQKANSDRCQLAKVAAKAEADNLRKTHAPKDQINRAAGLESFAAAAYDQSLSLVARAKQLQKVETVNTGDFLPLYRF